jgi:uncharacterized protein
MNTEQARGLLGLARSTVQAAVAGDPTPGFQTDAPALLAPCGAFVTIRQQGRLRGCIGRFTSDMPLWHTVREMAIASATQDPRFVHDRLTADDVPACQIEISVLSPLERTDDPLGLELGTHGIYIKQGHRTGCFLPQVAAETGWTKEEFLSRCTSGKAGLAPDAWQDSDTEVFLFTAEVIQEQDE